jgi:hypothetical protein
VHVEFAVVLQGGEIALLMYEQYTGFEVEKAPLTTDTVRATKRMTSGIRSLAIATAIRMKSHSGARFACKSGYLFSTLVGGESPESSRI